MNYLNIFFKYLPIENNKIENLSTETVIDSKLILIGFIFFFQ